MSLRGAAVVPRALVRLGHRHPWAVLAGAALVIAGGVLLGTRLRFETDVLNLMPRHDPVVRQFKQILEDFGSLETLLIAVSVKGEEDLERSLGLVDALAQELRQSPHLSQVEAQLEDPVKLAEAVLRHAVLFLDEEGLSALQERLTPEGLAARAADIRATLDTPQGIVAKEF
ncbi:MAG TPA: hypothetical protein VI700_02395, partial [Thermoanaerobaculaceae bacterium]|nr:hypothetical protein [Thermoanaerobaculaceae bacterium]